jgi:hypothetical protein
MFKVLWELSRPFFVKNYVINYNLIIVTFIRLYSHVPEHKLQSVKWIIKKYWPGNNSRSND